MSEIIQFSAFSRLTRPVSDKRPLGQRTREAKPALPRARDLSSRNTRRSTISEAAPSIGQEAQPAADRGACEAVEAIKGFLTIPR
jgi:hypothetical protein